MNRGLFVCNRCGVAFNSDINSGPVFIGLESDEQLNGWYRLCLCNNCQEEFHSWFDDWFNVKPDEIKAQLLLKDMCSNGATKEEIDKIISCIDSIKSMSTKYSKR